MTSELNPVSLKARDKKGRTAWDIAQTQKNNEVADILEQCAQEQGIDLWNICFKHTHILCSMSSPAYAIISCLLKTF